jgi:hypothetical protein
MVDLNDEFNDISFRLEITTDKQPQNELEPVLDPDTEVLNVRVIDIFEWVDYERRFISIPDLTRIGFNRQEIFLKNPHSEKIYGAQNGIYFTFQHLINVIEDFSKESRQQSNYMGGPDIYHVIFEGLYRNDDGSYSINWGI